MGELIFENLAKALELLKLVNISKAYSGVQALQDVSLTMKRNEIRCLAGENGSGKSTLIKIIAGVVQPDGGEIHVNGRLYRNWDPIQAIRAGIQIIYQDFSLFPNLTVAENIALNVEVAEENLTVNWAEVRRIAQHALDQINVRLDLDATVDQVSVADKQLIAISRALLQNAQLIVMDEPTTALTRREVQSLFSVVQHLQRQGISTLFVSHKLDEVLEISKRITVLRNGKTVIEADAKEFDHAKLAYHMTGRQIDVSTYDYKPSANTTPLLRVENLTSAGNFYNVSLELRAGEILGLAGLLGSGRTELALALFGIHPATSGAIYVHGKRVTIKSIREAMAQGIGYVPEDRLTEGLFLEQSIGRNQVVTTIDQFVGPAHLLERQRMRQAIRDWIGRLNIKTASPDLPVRTLSGGNQQRVVLAKWLASSPRILILNGPTVGVDIGSKVELHETMKRLAREGMGLLVISDDIPELMQTCNRIVLMQCGQVVDEFARQHVTANELTRKIMEDQATV
jgi:simple sugar transport system ATP-binding protein